MRRPDRIQTESSSRQSPSQVAPSTDRFPARPFTGLEAAPAMGSRATRQGRSSGMSPAERGAAGMHGPVARLLRSFLAAGRSTTTWRDRGVWTGSGPVAGFLAFAAAGPVRRGAVANRSSVDAGAALQGDPCMRGADPDVTGGETPCELSSPAVSGLLTSPAGTHGQQWPFSGRMGLACEPIVPPADGVNSQQAAMRWASVERCQRVGPPLETWPPSSLRGRDD